MIGRFDRYIPRIRRNSCHLSTRPSDVSIKSTYQKQSVDFYLRFRLIEGMGARSFGFYRQFYLPYPQILRTASAQSAVRLLTDPIWQTLSAIFEMRLAFRSRTSLIFTSYLDFFVSSIKNNNKHTRRASALHAYFGGFFFLSYIYVYRCQRIAPQSHQQEREFSLLDQYPEIP